MLPWGTIDGAQLFAVLPRSAMLNQMETVTTIIPAFNAASTLERTLRSAVAQTYPAHEILVVDDGSFDATPAIADGFAKQDARVRVIRQDNRGLAGARNRGLSEAAGKWVAPLDADDLWHPEKLARQVAALTARPGAALIYAWFRRIDEHDRVLSGSASPRFDGYVYHRHLGQNFVSNGSSPLILTSAAREIGYEETVSACEDYLFQLRLAERHEFVCVPAYLTGYRLRSASMSRDVERMIRAHIEVFRLLRGDAQPAARPIIDARIAGFEIELLRNRARRGMIRQGTGALVRALRVDPLAAFREIADELSQALLRSGPLTLTPGRPFAEYGPDEADGVWVDTLARRNRPLAQLDSAQSEGRLRS